MTQIDNIMQARADHRRFQKIAHEIQEMAKQTNRPVYQDGIKIDNYVRLSDVIYILQKKCTFEFSIN